MKKQRYLLLVLGMVLLLGRPSAYAIPDWTFEMIPMDGSVAGPPGSTVGWGYTISNPDPLNWLAPWNVSADSFMNGSPNLIFDFPLVAPLTTVTVPYDGINGFYQLTWDASAPVGFTNSGLFIVSADWYDADPFAGGNFLEAAPDRTALYSASVVSAAPAPVPEPAIWLLMASGFAGLALWRRRSASGLFSRT
jgi:hypothetical protein